jgi:hypothetical protein
VTAVPAPRPRLAPALLRTLAYAVAAAVLGLAGWFVAGLSDSALVPATAVLALAGAGALGLAGIRTGTMTSPIVLLCVPLLLSLAAAMTPITRIFGAWSPERLAEAVLIAVAPVVGVGGAMLLSRGGAPRLQRGTEAAPHAQRLVVVCALMCAAGTGVYLVEWSSIGGPPLLSGNIDQARFALVTLGPLHVLTEGVALALLIATWARIGRASHFSAAQRRVLEAIMCFVPLVLVMGGGRSLVLMPIVTALIVAARYVSRSAARRLVIVIPIAILLFSSVVFLARVGQNSPTGAVGSVLYNETGTKSSPLQSAYRSLSINLGEQLRVVAELREAEVRTPPFTSSMWFAHNFLPRAIDPQTIAGLNAGGWLTSTYAGGLLLDFGLAAALLFGVALGAAALVLYRRFARGDSVTIIWVYAYLAGPIALAFYLNVFLYFIFPIIDVIGLLILSRMLIQRPARTS